MNIEQKVIKIITEQLGMKKGDVTIESTRDSLTMDSLDDVEVIMAIEEVFDIELSDSDISNMTSVKSIVQHVTDKIKPTKKQQVNTLLEQWKKQSLDTAYDDLNSFYSLKAVFEWVVANKDKIK